MQFAYNDVANSEKLMTIEIGECIVIFSIISSYYSLDLRDENKKFFEFYENYPSQIFIDIKTYKSEIRSLCSKAHKV